MRNYKKDPYTTIFGQRPNHTWQTLDCSTSPKTTTLKTTAVKLHRKTQPITP
jgi:hypothetical protein